MMWLTLRDIERWTDGTILNARDDQRVEKLSIDSRESAAGVLFVALPGTHTDGHKFVPEVWAQGGIVLVRDDYPRQDGPQIRVPSPLDAMGQILRRYIDAHNIHVVGVTGSVGKTSVKELCAAALSENFATKASLGNFNTAIGLPLSFFSGGAQVTHFVAEMGMSASGEITRLTTIAPPEVAVITTIGSSHLEKLGSMEAIRDAKGEILSGLKPGGIAVLNRDNPWIRELAAQHHGPIRWFGGGEDVEARVDRTAVEEDGTTIQITWQKRALSIRIPWLGAHHAYNVAAALLVADSLGVSWDAAIKGIESIDPARSRVRLVEAGFFTLLIDVYNASPLSVKAALAVLRDRAGRRVAVIGDMLELGADEVPGHREIGRAACGAVDWLLTVGSRSKETHQEALTCGVNSHWVATREEALEVLKEELKTHDVVLLKASRGMGFEAIAQQLEEWGRSQ